MKQTIKFILLRDINIIMECVEKKSLYVRHRAMIGNRRLISCAYFFIRVSFFITLDNLSYVR